MKNMKQNITFAFKGYDPEEFMPVYREGIIENKDEFIAYKLKKAADHIIVAMDNVYYRIMQQ